MNDKNEPVNYFRMNIKAKTNFLDEVRYVSGIFNREALAEYFTGPISGATTQPAPGNTGNTGNKATASKDGDLMAVKQKAGSAAKVQYLNGNKPIDGAFLLLLSTQAEIVAEEIKSIAVAKQFGNQIAMIANKDTLVAGQQAMLDKADWENRGKNLETILNAWLSDANITRIKELEKTPGNDSTAEVAAGTKRQQEMLRLARLIAQHLGENPTFASDKDFQDWLASNRTRLMEGR